MRQQTVCVNATPGDARKAAEEIAANLRAAGNTVTIGEEYTLTQTHKAGLLAVDLTIEERNDSVEVASLNVQTTQTPTVEVVPEFPPITDEPAEAVEVLPFDEELEFVAEPEKPAKNKGGRPKGSKNKAVSA
jgi:hypothetical protein